MALRSTKELKKSEASPSSEVVGKVHHRLAETMATLTAAQKQALWRLEGTPELVERRRKIGLPVWADVRHEFPKLAEKLEAGPKPPKLGAEEVELTRAESLASPAAVPSKQGELSDEKEDKKKDA